MSTMQRSVSLRSAYALLALSAGVFFGAPVHADTVTTTNNGNGTSTETTVHPGNPATGDQPWVSDVVLDTTVKPPREIERIFYQPDRKHPKRKYVDIPVHKTFVYDEVKKCWVQVSNVANPVDNGGKKRPLPVFPVRRPFVPVAPIRRVPQSTLGVSLQ